MVIAIQVSGLHFQYENGKKALNDINIEIFAGERVAILGHNGAGKSTLLQHLNGLFTPQRGKVKIFNQQITKKNLQEIRQNVGLLFQDPDDQILALSVREDLAFGLQNAGFNHQDIEARIKKIAQNLQMESILDDAPQNLSLGQKKKVALAGLLIVEPEIILLDEPFAYLDQISQDELESILNDMTDKGKTLVMITHDIDRAWVWADKIIILKEGNLLYQGTNAILKNKAFLEGVYLKLPKILQLFYEAGFLNLPHNYLDALRMIKE